MSKRFSETTRFDDAFYASLPIEMKLAREFIAAKCDNAGVWNANPALAEYQLGVKVDWKDFQARLESAGEIVVLSNGSWLIKWFIQQQYGELNMTEKASNAHKAVLKLLREHRIPYPFPEENEGFMEPPWGSLTRQDPGLGKEGKGCGETTPTLPDVLSFASSPQGNVPPDVAEIWWNEHEARPRHASGDYTDKSGCRVMDWKAALRGFSLKWRSNAAQRSGNGNIRPEKPQPKIKIV